MHIIIQSISGYFLFLLAIIFSFYIPGSLLFSAVRLKYSFSSIHSAIISLYLGISVFLLITYTTAYLHVPKAPEFILGALSILWCYIHLRAKKIFLSAFSVDDTVSLVIILIGSLAFTSLMFFSGFQTKEGLQYFSTNSVDGIRHVAYITDQITHFPPQEPSLAGEPLKGFHYFYDFLLSRFSLFYSFSVNDLYFRYFPLFISLLYGFSFILLAQRMSLDTYTQRFLLFLVYFSQSSSIVLFLLNHSFNLTDDALVQPLGLIINPFLVLSLGILICGLSLLPLIKHSWKFSLVIGLLFGVLAEIKVYSGIIAIGCLLFYSMYLLIRYKKRYLFPLLVVLGCTGFLTMYTFFPNNLGSGGLVFAPFLFFRHYMQTELFTPLQWETRLLIYQQHANYRGIFLSYAIAMGIFILLNCGLRLVTLSKAKQLLSRSFWQSESNVILLCALLISFLIPSFFIQSTSVFDTIQFFWIALVLLCIPTAVIFGEFYTKLPLPLLKYGLVLCVLLATLPGVLALEYKYTLSSSRFVIPAQDVQTLQTVSHLVSSEDFITLVPPDEHTLANYPFPQGTPIVASLTGRQMYYEEGSLPSPDKVESQRRELLTQQLQAALIQCNSQTIQTLVSQIGSPYIVTIGNYPCLTSTLKTTKAITTNTGLISFYTVSLQ